MWGERSDSSRFPVHLGRDSRGLRLPSSAPSPTREGTTQVQPLPSPASQGTSLGPAWCPLPTFSRSCRKHQGTHWGPAHSKQVLVGQLQGGQGLGLQHGVQVDVAIGPCAQEEVPGWEVGQKARRADECGCPVRLGLPARLLGSRAPGKPPGPPNLGSSVRANHQSSYGETWAQEDCRSFEQVHGEAWWGSLTLPVPGPCGRWRTPPGRAFPTCGRGNSSQSRQDHHGGRR